MTEAERASWQATIDACWPAARTVDADGWRIRVTRGAGGRVSCISGTGDVVAAEDGARAAGQAPSFVVWPGQDALDAALDARGYVVADAVTLWTTGTAGAERPGYVSAFAVWPPLAIMRDLWEEGGIDAPRQAVMARAGDPTAILARAEDRPAGVAFVAARRDRAMLSAAYVPPGLRRRGVLGAMLGAARHWAAERGAGTLALACARDNAAAEAAYAAHGMIRAVGYHYRRLPEEP